MKQQSKPREHYSLKYCFGQKPTEIFIMFEFLRL